MMTEPYFRRHIVIPYVPYREAKAETRAAFEAEAFDRLLSGVRRWTCKRCNLPVTLSEIGVAYGTTYLDGSPICPTRDCQSIGWSDFVDDPESVDVPELLELKFRANNLTVECRVGERILLRNPPGTISGVLTVTGDTYTPGPGWVTKIVGPQCRDGNNQYEVWFVRTPDADKEAWTNPIIASEEDLSPP